MLKVLDLFSGIGGFSLGLERTGGFETVAFCEIEEFPRRVLAKHWPNVPCFEDVRKLKGSDIGPVDVICGGYPCQPFSTAGKRAGAEDDRHLWPEFSRLVAELRPAWVIGENVAGHISMGLDDVLSDLEGQGYACRTFVIPACAVGAYHQRYRCWTVAHANFERPQGYRRSGKIGGINGQWPGNIGEESSENVVTSNSDDNAELSISRKQRPQTKQPVVGECGDVMADSIGIGQPRQGEHNFARNSAANRKRETDHVVSVSQPGKWSAEPNVGRVAHGVPQRMDRLKALGNAVVPQIPEMIGRAILDAETMQR